MTGLIWTKFYWQDWLSDAGLRRCSLAARGLWMDLLCIAAQHDPIGYVAIKGEGLTVQDIARMVGESEPVVSTLIDELSRNGVFARDRNGKIYNRRMVADAKKAATAKKNGAKGGNPSLGNHNGNFNRDNPQDNGRVKTYKLEANKPENQEISNENRFSEFPGDGSIAFSPWAERARSMGRNIDVDVLAQAFRGWCRSKDIQLDNPGIGKQFDGFCRVHKVA